MTDRYEHPLEQTGLAMVEARCLMASVELGVFEALRDGPLAPDDLARRLGCRPVGLRPVLDVLSGMGALVRRAKRYGLSASSRAWLLEEAPASLVDLVRFNYDQWRLVSNLEERLRSDGADVHESPQPSGFWARYQRALARAAAGTAEELADLLPLDRPQRILDVGGGHGAFSVALCARHEGLTATILDLPEAAAAARELVAAGGERVELRAGDLRTADFGREAYDAVLLLGVAPHLTGAELRDALGRAAAALRPGGVVALMSPRPGGEGAAGASAAGSVLFWLMTDRSLPEAAEIRRWLADAGLARIREAPMKTAPGSFLLIGELP